ncbi:MAG: hypothetical protein ABL882_12395, partial [Sphingopyxis sp.]
MLTREGRLDPVPVPGSEPGLPDRYVVPINRAPPPEEGAPGEGGGLVPGDRDHRRPVPRGAAGCGPGALPPRGVALGRCGALDGAMVRGPAVRGASGGGGPEEWRLGGCHFISGWLVGVDGNEGG